VVLQAGSRFASPSRLAPWVGRAAWLQRAV